MKPVWAYLTVGEGTYTKVVNFRTDPVELMHDKFLILILQIEARILS